MQPGLGSDPYTQLEEDHDVSQNHSRTAGTAAEEHDLSWLHEALQWAVDLEFATIPVYLSGLWSIKPQGPNVEPSGEVYNLINSVVMEEMLHMALVCNMVTAIGGTPEINPTNFPGGLPGGVRPDLTVKLEGLSAS